MPDHAETISTKAVINGAEPEVFVTDIKASCDFFIGKLGFALVFTYGEPPFYGPHPEEPRILARRLEGWHQAACRVVRDARRTAQGRCRTRSSP